jgi:sodium transport system permease protein
MMSWKNIRLIFQREVRDQLRDRRTLFTITVLPLVLYPLLGMSFLQVTQFMQEHPTRVELRGSEWLPKSPALLAESHFADPWCNERERELLNLQIVASRTETTGSEPTSASQVSQEDQASQARREIESGKYDAILLIPPHFAEQLEEFRKSLTERASGGLTTNSTDVALPLGCGSDFGRRGHPSARTATLSQRGPRQITHRGRASGSGLEAMA